jgi:thiosulfate/3-mercaptopyruvate sulfurtransferase
MNSNILRNKLRICKKSNNRNMWTVTYCQGGYRAANTFVILSELGFKKAKLYLGSWNEWGNDMSLPIENN